MTIWRFWSATVSMFVISLSICYWLFKCRVLHVVCVCVCVCVCSRVRERETWSHHNRGLFANTYELHHCVCHVTLFPSQAWTDGKTKDIINLSLLLYWKLKLAIMERGVTFPTRLVVFGQSQCTVPVGQSEQTVLVERGTLVKMKRLSEYNNCHIYILIKHNKL